MTQSNSIPARVRDEGQKVDDPVTAARKELAQRELARKKLLPFIVRNVKKYQPGWVHKVICNELEEFSEQVARGESPRLIIEVPPRHGKSEIVSRNFPAWHLGRYPHHEIIACSYGADLAKGFSRKVRELVKDAGFASVFSDVALDPGAQNLDHWLLDGHDGGYAAAGVGGPITGKGMHCLRGDTLVETVDGAIRIDKLVTKFANTRVIAFGDGKERPQRVLAAQVTVKSITYTVKTDWGSDINCTGEHRFFVRGKGYVFARDLVAGDMLRGLIDGHREVTEVTRSEGELVEFFDIQVEGDENFFANGVLVHNCGIIDDYVKNAEEADSEAARNSLWNWYESTFKSRLAPGGGIIVMATRWHEDDLIGRILADEGTLAEGGVWKEIKFPAEALEDETYRKKGEPLHPERYTTKFFDQFRKNARVWWSLYQQSPVVEDGDYFKHDDFRFYRPSEMPPLDELTVYCTGDFAVGTREVNDFTVFTVVGVAQDGKIYVLDVFKLKEDSAAWVDKLFLIQDTYNPTLFIFEKGQISLAVEPFLKKRIQDEERWTFNYETMPTGRRDKVARARSIQGRMRQHMVLIPLITSAPWVKDWMDELKKFPNGKHDDQVDSFAYVGLGLDEFYSTTKKKLKPKTSSWRDQLLGRKRSTGSTHMGA